MAFTEKPPMLQGDTQQQINALRDYLFRMASSLDAIATAPVANISYRTTTRADGTRVMQLGSGTAADVDAIRRNADELKALIIKSADKVTSYVDSDDYKSQFVAESEYGEFVEIITPRVSEDHTLIQNIRSDFQTYSTRIDGQIQRGYITDSDEPTGYSFGIAISQNLTFTGDVYNDGRHNYYKLADNITCGLYTSSGWKFWVNGVKVGWFDSTNGGMLHLKQVVAREAFQISGDWQLKTTDDGRMLEFVYVGGGN